LDGDLLKLELGEKALRFEGVTIISMNKAEITKEQFIG